MLTGNFFASFNRGPTVSKQPGEVSHPDNLAQANPEPGLKPYERPRIIHSQTLETQAGSRPDDDMQEDDLILLPTPLPRRGRR